MNRIGTSNNWQRWALYLGAFLGLFQILIYLSMAFSYAIAPGYLDHFEPCVAEGALRVLYGLPVFHAPDAAERYASLYGPSIYCIAALFIASGSSVVMASKLMGLTGVILFTVTFLALIWKRSGLVLALLLTGYVLLNILTQFYIGYWTRPEPLMLLVVTAAASSFQFRDSRFSAILMGFSAAFLFNTKVHAALPLLPLFGVLAYERRWRFLTVSCIVSLGLILLPFCFSNIFSFPNYLHRLTAARSHGLSFETFILCVKGAVLAGIPVVLISLFFRGPLDKQERFAQRLFLLLLAAAGILTILIGSKPGAGPHHLIVYFPVLAYWMAWRIEGGIRIKPSPYWCLLLLGLWICKIQKTALQAQIKVWGNITRIDGTVLDDLHNIRSTHPNETIQVATAEEPDYATTWFRPELRLQSSVDLIDGTTLMDMVESGESISESTIDIIRLEKVDIWLVPRNAQAFSLRSWYKGNQDIFPQSLRKAFSEHYTRVETTQHFDIYRANRLLRGNSESN